MSEETVTRPPRKVNTKPTLEQKLAAVFSKVGYVQKDETANGGGSFSYSYVSERAVLEKVRPLLSEQKILFMPTVEDIRREGNLTTVLMEITFTDADSGGSISRRWAGTAADKGDKALYSAYTSGLRHFLMKFFMIPTGDDVENNHVEATPKPELSAAQTRLRAKTKEKEVNGPELAEMVARVTGHDKPDGAVQEFLLKVFPTLSDEQCEGLINDMDVPF